MFWKSHGWLGYLTCHWACYVTFENIHKRNDYECTKMTCPSIIRFCFRKYEWRQRVDWGKESQQCFCTDCIYNLRPISHLLSMCNLQISSNSLQTQIFKAAGAGRPGSVCGFYIYIFYNLLNLYSWVGVWIRAILSLRRPRRLEDRPATLYYIILFF
jgi:hypothetical protein